MAIYFTLGPLGGDALAAPLERPVGDTVTTYRLRVFVDLSFLKPSRRLGSIAGWIGWLLTHSLMALRRTGQKRHAGSRSLNSNINWAL
jgi:hypothetical protein